MLTVAAGSLALVRADIAARREAFQSEARAAHRLLSQRAAQHDAILATLTLLAPALSAGGTPEKQLLAVYPQVLSVMRRDAGGTWPLPELAVAEERSRASGSAAAGPADMSAGRFVLVRAGTPLSFALLLDLAGMVPWDEWPFRRDGPVRATLTLAGSERELHPGEAPSARPAGLTDGFVFVSPLPVPGQPFELRISRATGPAQWPWVSIMAWALGSAFALAALAAWREARAERRRAGELARIHRVERLNALGEYAAGVAHELNQPLTAVLTSAQTARRLLDDEEPDLAAARTAAARAATQARRAADVLGALRRRIESPASPGAIEALSVREVSRRVLDLFGPAMEIDGVAVRLSGDTSPVKVDGVALEQIIHNLVDNALKAMRGSAAPKRRLDLRFGVEEGKAVCRITDNGPGIAPAAMAHLFEPLNTTRKDGMGLGLAIAHSLTQALGGTLAARNLEGGGAEFRLTLPLAAE